MMGKITERVNADTAHDSTKNGKEARRAEAAAETAAEAKKASAAKK